MAVDPLAAYLLSVVKRQATCETREYREGEAALNELGYWLLGRPAWYARDKMPRTKIDTECRFVEEFHTYTPALGDICEGFDTMVDVYYDPKVVG